MIYVALAVFAACLVWAAAHDLWTMRIPNKCILVLFFAFFAAIPFAPMSWWQLADHAVVATVTLFMCYALFLWGKLGAGDGKLIAVTSLWLGPYAAMISIFLLAAFGGFLALAVLLMRTRALPVALATHPVVTRLQGEERVIPYALAISPAVLLALGSSPWAVAVPFIPMLP